MNYHPFPKCNWEAFLDSAVDIVYDVFLPGVKLSQRDYISLGMIAANIIRCSKFLSPKSSF
jgi:hypothetical protein